MGAAGAGASTNFEETASFDTNAVGGSFLVGLLGENALGNGFDSASFQILQGGNVIYSRSFSDLAGADAFFSNDLIDVSLGTSPDNIEIAFDEMLSAGEGFSFSYGAAAPAAVPEPSTWAMTLLGFAGLGFAGYRRARAGHATLPA